MSHTHSTTTIHLHDGDTVNAIAVNNREYCVTLSAEPLVGVIGSPDQLYELASAIVIAVGDARQGREADEMADGVDAARADVVVMPMSTTKAIDVLAERAAYLSSSIDKFPEHRRARSWRKECAALRLAVGCLCEYACVHDQAGVWAKADARVEYSKARHAEKVATSTTDRLFIDLTVGLVDQLHELARQRGVSLHDLLRQALVAFVESQSSGEAAA